MFRGHIPALVLWFSCVCATDYSVRVEDFGSCLVKSTDSQEVLKIRGSPTKTHLFVTVCLIIDIRTTFGGHHALRTCCQDQRFPQTVKLRGGVVSNHFGIMTILWMPLSFLNGGPDWGR